MKKIPVDKPRKSATHRQKPKGGAGPGASNSGNQPLAGTIRALKKYNAWRRGADMPQPDCKAVGRAIESAIAHLKLLKQERDQARLVAIWATKNLDAHLPLDQIIGRTASRLGAYRYRNQWLNQPEKYPAKK